MFLENLSEESKKIFSNAINEAMVWEHKYISTEHVFIALCKSEDRFVKDILGQFKIDPLFRREIRAHTGSGFGSSWGDKLILTPRMYRLLKLVKEAADESAARLVEPLHILYGLLKSGNGVAVRLLIKRGVNIDEMIQKTGDLLKSDKTRDAYSAAASDTPILNEIGRDLTALASQGKIDRVIGRKREIKKLAQILTMKKKSNPLLVGPAGVGKTAIVEGLALYLLKSDSYEALTGLRLVEINLSGLIAQTKYRGELEDKFRKLINEIIANKQIIVFIDEIHTLLGAGKADGGMDVANMFKPFLARGDIRCIGATTLEEYNKYVRADSAFERRFHKVIVSEPTREDAIDILNNIKGDYENHHHVKITDEAITAAVDMSIRYLPDRRLPDKAIDIIDQVAAKKRIINFTLSEISHAALPQNAADNTDGSADVIILASDIADLITEMTGIPVTSDAGSGGKDIKTIEEFFRQRIIGQDEAVKAIAQTIRISKAGLANANRPIGVFIFLGSSGIGKTECAKVLADFLFDDENRIVRFDMSEYAENGTISKLIGAPPGYIGHDKEGQLTGAIKNQPYSVLLFDEIEKAHPAIFNLFLQIFDDGRLTDSRGNLVDFKNTIIIMTSNIGSYRGGKVSKVGFNQLRKSFEEYEQQLAANVNAKRVLESVFSPEFINRIDRIIQFNPLSAENMRPIINNLLKNLKNQLAGKGLSLELDEPVYDFLIEKGFDEQYGAREMKRAILNYITEPIANFLLENEYSAGDTLMLSAQPEGITLSVRGLPVS